MVIHEASQVSSVAILTTKLKKLVNNKPRSSLIDYIGTMRVSDFHALQLLVPISYVEEQAILKFINGSALSKGEEVCLMHVADIIISKFRY